MISSDKFLSGVYTDKNSTKLPYRYYKPDCFDNRPLLVFLHGAGERGTDNEVSLNGVSPFAPEYELTLEKYGSYFLVPQCANDFQWVDTPWVNGSFDSTNIKISKYLSAAKELIDNFVEENKIDKSRIYIMGCSMGGYGTWDMITRFPGYFRAALPICGAGDPAKAELIKNMPLWVFHGDADDSVPVTGSRDMVCALKNAGSDVIYTEVANYGHNIWKYVHESRIIYDWLFSR